MKTYGISETKRYVINLQASLNAVVKIEQKLPEDAAIVTGVHFSIAHTVETFGIVSLRFSEGASNTLLRQRVSNVGLVRRKRFYTPVHERVTPASLLQGYYRDGGDADTSYTFKIYIEYIPCHCEAEAK